MNNKEVIFYENLYDIGPETCEYISDQEILRSENGLIESSYPTGIKEIKADGKSLSKFWKILDDIDIWS